MNYKIINTAGQITAVITEEIIKSDLPQIAKAIMEANPTIEQVGYLQNNDFQMMGGELSINGLIAGATLLGDYQSINGYTFKVRPNNQISLTLPRSIVISQRESVIKLQGITYQLIAGIPRNRIITPMVKQKLLELAQDTTASGIIYYEQSNIMPLIYVPATDSYVWEKACGSGSLATALFTRKYCISQPSGQLLVFSFTNKNIIVTTTSKEV